MYIDRTIPVVPDRVHRKGRCRYCRRPVIWATTPTRVGKRARCLPFDARPVPLRRERNDETGVVIEFWPRASLHVVTCPKHPPRPTYPPPVRPDGSGVDA
jgi:hypothetical protein